MVHELEKELSKRIADHKEFIITSSLIIFEKDGIYNSHLLQEKYGNDKMTERGDERAYKVTDELKDNADQETYDKIYKMCWQRAKHKIQDKLYGMDS